MKINFLYVTLLSVLIFSCKGTTDPKPDPNPADHVSTAKAGAQVVMPPTTTGTFLSLSDVHINGNMMATAFGNVSGTRLWKRAKTKIEEIVKLEQPKFMVYLGDLPAYIDVTRAQNSHIMLQNLRSLNINIPILYLPGNNDSLEGDYHSFANGNNSTVLKKDTDANNPWPVINADAGSVKITNLDFSDDFGYYSVDIVDGANTLKVIALNTVIFSGKTDTSSTGITHIAYNSKKNAAGQYVYGDDHISQQQATEKQMRWLEGTFKSLRKADHVMIMMHIPIGLDGYGGKPMWNTALTYKDLAGNSHTLHDGFISLLAQYKANITGLLNGHTHTDGLRRIYNTTRPPSGTANNPKDMVSFSISTPGIAVNHDNNPAFKIFTYDSNTFSLLDFETYFASPTKKIGSSVNNTDFVFMKDSSYTFNNVYEVTKANTPMFTTLANESDSEVVQHVNETLGARSNQDVTLRHDDAVDVHKN
ncbi:MAG: metallophosphoesterase [Bacteroidota bacterium]